MRSSRNRCGSKRKWCRPTSGKAAEGRTAIEQLAELAPNSDHYRRLAAAAKTDALALLDDRESNGHALEAETAYSRFLHGEAVAFGMQAAVHLAEATRHLTPHDGACIRSTIQRYGPIPSLDGIPADNLLGRLVADKKTIQGKVHFVLPRKIGEVTVVSGVDPSLVLSAIQAALA